MDLDELIATASPRTQTVQVCARGDLVARHEELVEQLGATAGTGSLGGNSDAHRISEEIVAVEEAMDASTLSITLRSVSRKVWADLLAKHPPGREHKGQDHNPETFPPAALAACAVEPPITVEQATKLADTLPTGEWNKLWLAMIGLNVVAMPHPKLAAATELLRANGRSSTTSADTDSLAAPSSAGSGEASPPTTTTTTDA